MKRKTKKLLPETQPERLSQLRNLGEKAEAMLASAGIATPNDLVHVGPVEAYLRVKRAYPRRVSKLMLYALLGAVLDCHWNDLPMGVKEDALEKAEAGLGQL